MIEVSTDVTRGCSLRLQRRSKEALAVRTGKLLGAASLIALLSAPALAQTTYDWTYAAGIDYSGNPVPSGSGTLTIGAAEGGGFAITGITGTFDGSTITGLVAAPGLNILYPNGNGGTCDSAVYSCLPAYLNGGGVEFYVDPPPPVNTPSNENSIYWIGYSLNTAPGTLCCYYSDNLAAVNEAAEATFTITQVNCFLRGTHILTSDGEVSVQKLKVGDLILTVDNRRLPIKRIVAELFDPSPAIMPVRIACGALGSHAPRRDLYVSPAHCLLIDGVLIPAVQHGQRPLDNEGSAGGRREDRVLSHRTCNARSHLRRGRRSRDVAGRRNETLRAVLRLPRRAGGT